MDVILLVGRVATLASIVLWSASITLMLHRPHSKAFNVTYFWTLIALLLSIGASLYVCVSESKKEQEKGWVEVSSGYIDDHPVVWE